MTETALETTPRVGVAYWYRHETDPSQTQRPTPQCYAPMVRPQDIPREVALLHAQGYTVQRVETEPHCPTCQGQGRTLVRVYKTKPAKYRTCATCQGRGTDETQKALRCPDCGGTLTTDAGDVAGSLPAGYCLSCDRQVDE